MQKCSLVAPVLLSIVLAAALLPATAALAASSLNFSWGPECASDALVINKDFTCLNNTGSDVMVASFVPTENHQFLLAVDGVVDIQAATGLVIPDWWQFKNIGACRLTSLSAGQIPSGAAVLCADDWAGQATASVDYYGDPVWLGAIPVPIVAGNRARAKIGVSIPVAAANPVGVGQEYFAFTLSVNNLKTVGTGLCTGCLIPMAAVFNSIMPGYQDGADPDPIVFSSETIATPLLNNCITWQGGAVGLCQATPTLNKTWGQVKSLYR